MVCEKRSYVLVMAVNEFFSFFSRGALRRNKKNFRVFIERNICFSFGASNSKFLFSAKAKL